MTMTKLRTYSEEGPSCPRCGFTFTPDESIYYEPRYTEDTCQECGCKFSVEVEHSGSWVCEAEAVRDEKSEGRWWSSGGSGPSQCNPFWGSFGKRKQIQHVREIGQDQRGRTAPPW